jgi:hypothetical protein
VADYDPKARRARPEPAADEPVPVDALLDAVEQSADVPPKKSAKPKPTLNGTAEANSKPAPVGEPVASPVFEPVSAPVAPPNPWVSSVPEPASSKVRLVIVVAAVVAALVVIRAVVRRRRS